MAKNKTEQREIEYRRQCVKDTWIKLGVFGVTQEQITKALADDYQIDVDRSTISRDLAAVKNAMQERTPEDLKAYLMAEYEYLLGEARQGWTRSQEDAVTETSEMIEVPEVGKDKEGKPIQVTSQRLKASTKRIGQAGDSSFLAEIRQTTKSIREMFGVDAATKQQNLNIDLSQLSDAQLQRIAAGEDPLYVIATTEGGG
jgi:hypothetical protein